MSVYRNVIAVEVLSSEPWGDEITDLAAVAAETVQGGSSGLVTVVVVNEVLTPRDAAERLVAQGSDPEFLLGDDHCRACYAPAPDSTATPPLCAACASGQTPPAPGQPAAPVWIITVDGDRGPLAWTPIAGLSPGLLGLILGVAARPGRTVRIQREAPGPGGAAAGP